MKRLPLLPLLLLLAITAPAQTAITATVEVSRTLCLVRFVTSLAGGDGGFGGTRRAFEATRFNTPAARRQLARYQALDHTPSFARTGYPPDRLASFATPEPAYLAGAAAAPTLADLPAHTVGLLPNEVLAGLDSIYRYFDPIFDTLAWQPHAAELARQRTAYAAFLSQGRLLQSFGRLRAFYGSVWPDALPYRIQLCPQLDDKKGFTNHGYVSGNLVLLDCHPTSRDFVDGSTVVFHEMAHSLSVQQRLALQQRIDRWYTKNPSPNRRHAYYLMEEALATAAGEWVHAQQTGQPEPGEWYNDDYINRYARALYPAVTAYVERGQTLDSAFVAQAITTFDRTFPQAATDYVNLFRKVLYWTDADDTQATIQPFADQFHSTLSNTSNPILADTATLALAQGGAYTPVVLVTRQHAATLRYLRQNFPVLRPYQLAPDQNFVLALTTPTGPLIVVNTHSPQHLQTAAAALKRQGQINPQIPLTTLK